MILLLLLCYRPALVTDPNALGQHGPDHALIGGVVAVVVFITLCLIIVLGRYLARHKGKKKEEKKKGRLDSSPCWQLVELNDDLLCLQGRT